MELVTGWNDNPIRVAELVTGWNGNPIWVVELVMGFTWSVCTFQGLRRMSSYLGEKIFLSMHFIHSECLQYSGTGTVCILSECLHYSGTWTV